MATWNEHYLSGHTPWDLGGPSPLVQRLATEVLDPGAAILVPGAGLGHDAEALARQGHRVTALDIAPAAVQRLRERTAGLSGLDARAGDFLDLEPALEGRFDAVVEHTCFCALDPVLLGRYAASAARALAPEGVLFGAFLLFEGGGPPHGTTLAAIEATFAPWFIATRIREAPEAFEPLGVPQAEVVLRRRHPEEHRP